MQTERDGCGGGSVQRTVLPRLGESALKDEGDVGDTLRANVAEKLADIWLATHLRAKHKQFI